METNEASIDMKLTLLLSAIAGLVIVTAGLFASATASAGGTPALTTRGMGTDEMTRIADWMLEVLQAPDDVSVAERIRGEIRSLCQQFPVPAAAVTANA